MANESNKELTSVWTPANIVTCVRIVFIPVFMIVSALLLFLDFGAVTVWSVFIILFRELLVSALRMVASAAGVVVAADKLGKYKTATTMVSICGYLCVFAMAGLQLGPVSLLLGVYSVSRFLYVIAVILTIVSGAQYFWNCRKIVFSV